MQEIIEDNNVIVSVTDSGCGMDETTLSHVYDKFYKGDTSRSTEGNGLGLALEKRILALSGGRINVESQIGIGTSFYVALPINAREATKQYEK